MNASPPRNMKKNTSGFLFSMDIERGDCHVLKHCKTARKKFSQDFLRAEILHENPNSKGFEEIQNLQSFLHCKCYALISILILAFAIYLDILNVNLFLETNLKSSVAYKKFAVQGDLIQSYSSNGIYEPCFLVV